MTTTPLHSAPRVPLAWLSGARALPALAAAFSAAMLAGAYLFEWVGGLAPCQLCWWQRWAHMGVLAAALVSLAAPRVSTARALVVLALATSAGVAGFHAGVEYGWWEGLLSCTAGIGDLDAVGAAPSIFDDLAAPTVPVDCSKPAWTLLGVSMAGWNAVMSAGALVACLALWRQA